jgi:hypothetical protein
MALTVNAGADPAFMLSATGIVDLSGNPGVSALALHWHVIKH